jgi:hypothetical protein
MSDFDQLAIELHKPIIKKFEKRRVEVNHIDETFGADLVDMGYWKDYNKKYRYILTVIDIFSKFAWAIPMITKTGAEVTEAFETIFKHRVPENLWVDRGSEFYNSTFKALLKKHNITLYSTYGDHKSAVIERFNRTLKGRMQKKFTSYNRTTFIWLPLLPILLKEYNHSRHSTIKITPIKASLKENEDIVFANTYDKNPNVKPKKKPSIIFKKGDMVRITKIKGVFEKGYEANWTNEVFFISEIYDTVPVVYSIIEYDGSPIEGNFYTQELQKVKTDVLFQLDGVMKTRTRNKKKEHFVHWFGWGSKYDEWISDAELKSLI